MGPRKYFLDWLRVIAFGGLILFHTGMLYVTWGYNLKSARLVPDLEWVMEALSPWRMALLFVISGVASRFLVERLGAGGFARNRLARLLPVLATGMLLVNPVQVWVQLRAQGDTSLGYVDYWLFHYLLADSRFFEALGRPTPTWDHLWFLLYLLAYGLVFAWVFRLLGRSGAAARTPLAVLLVAPAVWMAGTNLLIATVAPFTHAFFDDWGAHLKWAGLFLTGTLLASRAEAWDWLAARRWRLLGACGVMLAMYLACREPWREDEADLAWTAAYRISEGIYGWLAVLTIAGFAKMRLDRPSRLLGYLTDAVLPIYVLHQPVLLATAWLVFPLRLTLPLEAAVVVAATAAIPLLAYHLLIRPWPPMRLAFGLRPAPRA
jgi:surface polysaccharide O-acyltransferase-like enzyme